MKFDPETLDLLADAYEVRITTTRSDGTPRQKIIWVMVDGDDAFVRSVRGEKGRWYQRALARPDTVEMVIGKRVLPVRVMLADDADSVARCTAALQEKYGADPALRTMLKPDTLATTLRLEPR